MAMATYSTYKANEDGGTYRRDASFSSYLDSTERDFFRNLAASIHSQSSPTRNSPVTPRESRGKNRTLRSELGVFGAEMYFNEKLDEQKSPIPRKNRGVIRGEYKHRKEKTVDPKEKNASNSTFTTTSFVKSPTPSLKSEGNCNNHNNVLKILNGLPYKGICFDKKSTYTMDTKAKVQSRMSYKRDNKYMESKVSNDEHFAFPIIHSTSYDDRFEDQPKKSLEVFAFRHIGKQELTQNIERKVSFVTWDAIPNLQNPQIPFPNTKSIEVDHEYDTRSEASSDLFEIENLSGINASQSSYASSEASVEWSVVTASATEFSASSECPKDEKTGKKMPTMEKIKVQKNSLPSLGGVLLGCTSHKATDVLRSLISNTSNNKKITKVAKLPLLPYYQDATTSDGS